MNEEFNRDDTSDGMQQMDERRFERIKTAFERRGGMIISSPDIDRRLNNVGAEASTLNQSTILLKSGRIPSASAMFEELIHSAQYRTGRATGDNWVDMEIEAKAMLIRNQIAYGITDEEHRITLMQLEELRRMKGGV